MSKRKIKKIESFREEFIVQSIMDEELTTVKNPAVNKEFDEDGNLILEIQYSFGGAISEKYSYRFQNGKMVEKNTYFDEEEIAETEIYEYENDKISKLTKKYNEGYEEEFRFEYNAQGKLISKKSTEEDGEKQIYEYSSNETEVKSYNEDGELISSEKSIFDDKQNLIKSISQNFDLETFTNTEYQYDENNNVILEIEKDESENVIQVIKTEYDSKGRPSKTITKSDKNSTILTLEYDEFDNEIHQLEVDEDGEVNYNVKRKYDKEGNIIETNVEIFGHGVEQDMVYNIYYNYEFFD